jgi:hypothetical protein
VIADYRYDGSVDDRSFDPFWIIGDDPKWIKSFFDDNN